MTSAVLYTAANIYLRKADGIDPVLVSAVKALPSVIAAGTLVLWDARRGRTLTASPRAYAALIVAALIAHMGGNVGFQWSLGVIGLALSVPLCLGAMIIAATIAGRVWLREGVTPRTLAAIALLLASISMLSFDSRAVDAESARASGWFGSSFGLFAGAAAACASGVAYACMNVVVRRVVTGVLPISVTWLIVAVVGVGSLAPLSLARIGVSGIENVRPDQWTTMALAGMFNAAAFFYLTKALQLVPIVQVNIVNASQTALAAVAGVLLFAEPATIGLAIGVAISVVGVLLVQRPVPSVAAPADLAADPHSDPDDGPQHVSS